MPTKHFDLLLIVLVLQWLSLVVDEQIEELESTLLAHIREQRRLNRSLPIDKVRVTWETFCAKVSSSHFRKMFRMAESVFNSLCGLIRNAIGEETFRSEAYLYEKFERKDRVGKSPPISGEVKVAISIRMLAGGSYLDLVPMFDVSGGHVYVIFGNFLSWVLKTLTFPLVPLIREQRWDVLEDYANQFAEKTNGIFYGVFGALDGLAVRIRSPTLSEVSDPGNYYCRKGFFAINVQAIVDLRKRFLWVGSSNKGSTHDSNAFTGSRLYDLLIEVMVELYKRGLFLAGDSAYGLTPFLLIPYEQSQVKENGDPNGSLDSFNFHLSSCRIQVECAFGELVMRWGILWRTLLFDLKKAQQVVQVCMLLQNFIIDNRDSLGASSDRRYFQTFGIEMDTVQQEITEQTGEMPRAVVTDNNEPKEAGRKTVEEDRLREEGGKIRHRLSVQLGQPAVLETFGLLSHHSKVPGEQDRWHHTDRTGCRGSERLQSVWCSARRHLTHD